MYEASSSDNIVYTLKMVYSILFLSSQNTYHIYSFFFRALFSSSCILGDKRIIRHETAKTID